MGKNHGQSHEWDHLYIFRSVLLPRKLNHRAAIQENLAAQGEEL